MGPDFGAGGALPSLPSTATGHVTANRAARMVKTAKSFTSLMVVSASVCSA